MIRPLTEEPKSKPNEQAKQDAQQAEALQADSAKAAAAQQALKQTSSKASLLAQQMVNASREISEANRALATFVKQEGPLPKEDVATKTGSGLDRSPSPEATVKPQEPASTIPVVAGKDSAPDTTKTSTKDHSGRPAELPHKLAKLGQKLNNLTTTLRQTSPEQLAKALKGVNPTLAKTLLDAKTNLATKAERLLKNLKQTVDRGKASDPQAGVAAQQVKALEQTIKSLETLLKTLSSSEGEGLPEQPTVAPKGSTEVPEVPEPRVRIFGQEKGDPETKQYADAVESKVKYENLCTNSPSSPLSKPTQTTVAVAQAAVVLIPKDSRIGSKKGNKDREVVSTRGEGGQVTAETKGKFRGAYAEIYG